MCPAIRVENLSKRYLVSHEAPRGHYRTLRESLVTAARVPLDYLRGNGHASREEFWALKDVSFQVEPGEVLGVIGRNGAGKSTLLKILSRITEPTEGRVDLYGRVGSLLEVGTGFHPELTGRENIYLSAAILGMRRAEIDRKFDEIVAFAEVEKFIDTPVKHFSSGMYVRLAFAVAAHLDPEILLVDEVLAVGDANFQKKCLGKMGEVARGGRTVLFVSHNMASIESLCDGCVLLRNGIVDAAGQPQEIIARYLNSEISSECKSRSLIGHPGRRPGSRPAMTLMELDSGDEFSDATVRMGSDLSISVSYSADHPIRPVLGIAVKTGFGAPVFAVSERFSNQLSSSEPLSAAKVVCKVSQICLMPGRYLVDLYLGDVGGDFDIIYDAMSFEIIPADVYGTGRIPGASFGPIFCMADWELKPDSDNCENPRKLDRLV